MRALVSRDTPPDAALHRQASPDQIARIGVRRQLLLVAVGARERVLAAEILDVTEPVAEDALRQPPSQMSAEAPKDHADLVF